MISCAVASASSRVPTAGRFQFVTRRNGGVARHVAAGVGQPQLAPRLGQLARQRRRLAEQEALAERGAERARGGQLLLGVDALGEHQRLAALALRADRADDPRDVGGRRARCRRRRSSLITSG